MLSSFLFCVIKHQHGISDVWIQVTHLQSDGSSTCHLLAKCWKCNYSIMSSPPSHLQVLPPHLLSRRPKTAAEWFYSVSLQAGIQNLRCSGWTVRETSSLLDLQRQSEVLMTSILSAAEWLWRRDTATASPVESNRTTPTRSERHTYMFQVENHIIRTQRDAHFSVDSLLPSV